MNSVTYKLFENKLKKKKKTTQERSNEKTLWEDQNIHKVKNECFSTGHDATV